MATKLERTPEGLRAFLLDQIEGVANGSVTTQQAAAVGKLSAQLLKSVEVEIQYRAQQVELRRIGADKVDPLRLAPPKDEVTKPSAAEESEPRRPRVDPSVPQGARFVPGSRY